MRGKVEAVRAEEEALRTQVDGELSQLIKSAQLTVDPVSKLKFQVGWGIQSKKLAKVYISGFHC